MEGWMLQSWNMIIEPAKKKNIEKHRITILVGLLLFYLFVDDYNLVTS